MVVSVKPFTVVTPRLDISIATAVRCVQWRRATVRARAEDSAVGAFQYEKERNMRCVHTSAFGALRYGASQRYAKAGIMVASASASTL